MIDLSLPLLYYDTHRNKFFYRKVELTHNNPLICDYGYEVVALGICMTSGKPVLKSIINIECSHKNILYNFKSWSSFFNNIKIYWK